MMRKLPWVLLAVSITFNFAFTGGLLEARQARDEAVKPEKAPGDKSDLVARRLGLDDQQREAYVQARRSLADKVGPLREEIALAREERRAELAGAEPDLGRVAELEARMADLSCQMRTMAAETMRQFVSLLTPEQRRNLGGMMRSHGRHTRSLPSALQRFDKNRDGRLDERERRAAHDAMHKWHKSRSGESRAGSHHRSQSWRQEMIRRFDADGDGVLDDAERAKAMKARRGYSRGADDRETPRHGAEE